MGKEGEAALAGLGAAGGVALIGQLLLPDVDWQGWAERVNTPAGWALVVLAAVALCAVGSLFRRPGH